MPVALSTVTVNTADPAVLIGREMLTIPALLSLMFLQLMALPEMMYASEILS